MANHFIIDISGYNLYKNSALALTAAVLNPPKDEESSKFMREFSRVPIGTKKLHAASLAVTAGLVYVPVDFRKMRAEDTRHPEAVYIKAAHGYAGPGYVDQYPIEDYGRPAADAKAAGWGYGPYHYFYMDMDAQAQAVAFYNCLNAVGTAEFFGTMDPLVDLEDNVSSAYKSMLWDGVSDPLTKIMLIKSFLGTAFRGYLETVDRQWSAKLGRAVLTRIYSGAWFWNPLINTLLLDHANQTIADYYAPRLSYTAWYTPDHTANNLSNMVTMKAVNNQVLQFTSTAVPPVVGLNVPGINGINGSSLDIGVSLKTDAEFYKFAGIPDPNAAPPEPPQPPAGTIGTYKQTVKIADRAFGTWIHTDDPREDMPAIAKSAAFVILDLAGEDNTPGKGNELYSGADTFRIRADRAAANGIADLGMVMLDPGYEWWRQWDLDPFKARAYQKSEILTATIQTWRKINTFNWANLRANDGNWHPLSGILLGLYKTSTYLNQQIGGAWQVAVLDDMIKYLTTFMAGGYIPKIPIWVYSNPSFFLHYSQEKDAAGKAADSLSPYLLAQLSNGNIAGLAYGDPVPDYPRVPTAETLTLAEVSSKYRFPDGYKYSFFPYKFDAAVKIFVYSWERFKVAEIMNRDGTGRVAAAAVADDTTAGFYKEINFVPAPVQNPPDEPPVDNPPDIPPVDNPPASNDLEGLLAQVIAAAKTADPKDGSNKAFWYGVVIEDLEKVAAEITVYLK